MMTRTELLADIQPIIRAYSNEVADTTDSKLLPQSIEVHCKSCAFGGRFLEDIASYCRANFQPWIVMTDGDGSPVISLNYTE